MKRRKAIKQIGLGLSAGLMMPQFLISCGKDDPGPEVPFDGTVAIIGAGPAGLYAADILHAKGISVAIYEASAQVGGRLKSLRNQTDYQQIFDSTTAFDFGSDFPLELGAEIVFGSDSIFGKIITTAQIPTVDLGVTATDKYILDNQAKSAVEWQGDGEFSAALNFATSLPNYAGADVTAEQAAPSTARTKALMNSMIGNFYGTSSSTLGIAPLAASLKKRTHDGKRIMVKTNPMQDILQSRFSLVTPFVKLNTPIKTINYSGDVVILKDASGNQYEAKKVIITSPVAVLKSSAMTFSPALPGSMTTALNKVGMDTSIRMLIDFKKNFWGEATGFIWGGSEGPMYINSGVGRSEFSRTMSVTINGTKAAQLSAMSRQNQLNAILAELDAIYAGQATQFVRHTLPAVAGDPGFPIVAMKDWSKEEYVKGGNSYPLPGFTEDDRKNLSTPINKKLFFAGEATDISGDAGNINGAFASAERAAQEIVDSILGTTAS